MRLARQMEWISPKTGVFMDEVHRFFTDTVLLAWYALPRRGEICADFGTGCGFLPLYWCDRARPAHVTAIDLQESACALARLGVQESGLAGRISVLQHDLRDWRSLPLQAGEVDAIACNPPYQAPGTGDLNRHEGKRIARHETALCFQDIAMAARHFLRWGGRFTCCHRPDRLCDVIAALRAHGLEPKRLRFVQQRREKAPFLFLLRAVRGGKPGLMTDPVLFVEDPTGALSQEMLSIYGDYKQGRAKNEQIRLLHGKAGTQEEGQR